MFRHGTRLRCRCAPAVRVGRRCFCCGWHRAVRRASVVQAGSLWQAGALVYLTARWAMVLAAAFFLLVRGPCAAAELVGYEEVIPAQGAAMVGTRVPSKHIALSVYERLCSPQRGPAPAHCVGVDVHEKAHGMRRIDARRSVPSLLRCVCRGAAALVHATAGPGDASDAADVRGATHREGLPGGGRQRAGNMLTTTAWRKRRGRSGARGPARCAVPLRGWRTTACLGWYWTRGRGAAGCTAGCAASA